MPSRILRLWNPTASAWEEVGDSRLTTHLAAADPHPGYLLESLVDAKGDLLAASADNTPGRLAVGADTQVLTADSTQTLGLRWAAPASGGMANPMTAEGDVILGAAAGAPTRLALGTTGQVLTAAAATSAGDLYPPGAPAPAFVGTSAGGWGGNRFSAGTGVTVSALAWYRGQTSGPAPTALRLRDTVAGTDVATVTPADNGLVGWQLATITPVALVASRLYLVAGLEPGGYNVYRNATPVAPDAPFTWQDAQYGMTYPAPEGTLTAEAQYSVRVSGGAGPRPAWQNPFTQGAADARYLQLTGGTLTGDLVLSEATPTVSLKLAADTQPRSRLSDTALAFGPGGTTAPDATLQRTGAGALRVDNNLGVGGAVPAGIGATVRSVQVGERGALTALATGGTTILSENTYFDGSVNRAVAAAAGGQHVIGGGQWSYSTAASVAAGATQTMTERARIGTTGTLTLTPDAGQPAVQVGGYVVGPAGAALTLQGQGANNVQVLPGGNIFHPGADNAIACGIGSARWTAVYAVAGTINTSSADAKQAITPLDPTEAMAAVRNTQPVTFDYRPPERTAEWYELPDDPEQAEAVLLQRLTAAPLEAAARHQAGVVLGSDQYPCDPLFEIGTGQTSASNGVGILLSALKQIDQRLTALEGA